MTSGTYSLNARFHSLMRERFISNKMNSRLSMVKTWTNLSHDERGLFSEFSLTPHSAAFYALGGLSQMRFFVPGLSRSQALKISSLKMTLLNINTSSQDPVSWPPGVQDGSINLPVIEQNVDAIRGLEILLYVGWAIPDYCRD